VQNRDALMIALNEHDIFPGVHYRDNTDYRMYAFAQGTCPNAAGASKEIISLPMHLRMTKSDVDRISELVVKYAQ
jgi:dTDP-4-amino-4,6-dideoxygalactose transaminase